MIKIADFVADSLSSVKSLIKMAILSRPIKREFRKLGAGRRMLILGNGPALATDLAEHLPEIIAGPSMVVNFAGNAPEFFRIRPAYYIMIDPAFFDIPFSEPMQALLANLKRVDWDMHLFLPVNKVKQMQAAIGNPKIRLIGINPVGVEGWKWLETAAYSSGLGMPRPRNVLIAAIMAAIAIGCKEIYLLGADHSWSRTLWVDEENYVVSVQPHFYKDDPEMVAKSRAFFKNVKIHEVMESYSIAFRGYHRIKDYARKKGITIFNATVGSFIDAFPRRKPW